MSKENAETTLMIDNEDDEEFLTQLPSAEIIDEMIAEATRRVDSGEGCGQRRCNAGGPPEHHGHLFDLPYEDEEERLSGFMCRCGMNNITFTLLNVGW